MFARDSQGHHLLLPFRTPLFPLHSPEDSRGPFVVHPKRHVHAPFRNKAGIQPCNCCSLLRAEEMVLPISITRHPLQQDLAHEVFLVFYFRSIWLTFWCFIYQVHSPLLTNKGYVTKSFRVVELSLASALLLTRDVICNKSLISLSRFPPVSHGDSSTCPAAIVRTRG